MKAKSTLLVFSIVFFSFILLGTGDVYAQKSRSQSGGFLKSKSLYPGSQKSNGAWGFLGGVGWASYFGELCNTGDCFATPRPQLGFGIKYRFNTFFSVRGVVHGYRIVGSDAEFGNGAHPDRNLSFRSDNIEGSINVVFDLIPVSKFYEIYANRRFFGVYVFGGVGMTYLDPRTEITQAEISKYDLGGEYDAGDYVRLTPLETEGESYSNFAVIFPAGIGFRYKLGRFSDLTLEYGHRFMLTDRLDDVSADQYAYNERVNETDPILNNPEDNPVAREELLQTLSTDEKLRLALSDRRSEGERGSSQIRGNPSSNDGYYILTIKYEWTLDPSDPLLKRRFQMGQKRKMKRKTRRPTLR